MSLLLVPAYRVRTARCGRSIVSRAATRKAESTGASRKMPSTGVLFFGALSHGYGPAFERCVLQMGALLLVVAALTRLMPRGQRPV
jgi:hypothetical protein